MYARGSRSCFHNLNKCSFQMHINFVRIVRISIDINWLHSFCNMKSLNKASNLNWSRMLARFSKLWLASKKPSLYRLSFRWSFCRDMFSFKSVSFRLLENIWWCVLGTHRGGVLEDDGFWSGFNCFFALFRRMLCIVVVIFSCHCYNL